MKLAACVVLAWTVGCTSRESTQPIAEKPALPPPSATLASDPPDAAAELDAGALDAAAEEDARPEDATTAEEEPAFSACNAPSVKLLRAYDDDRTLGALSRCLPDGGYAEGYDAGYVAMIENEQSVASRCGQTPRARKLDLPRMIDSALPLDSATRAHVRAIFRDGKTKGRRADVFGLVGDSITIDHSFMRPFSWTSRVRTTMSPAVRDALAIDDGKRTIVDFFRGFVPPDVDSGASTYFDSYTAVRAAKIGARANWAITPDANKITPIADMIDQVSPAYAVVMYGTNDAQWYGLPLSNIDKNFGAALRAVVDALEERAVIPILTTIPKHMHDRRFVDCAPPGSASNARSMVQTNVANAVIAAVACERHVPLIDYRYAIDPLLDHGVTGDGVHPSLYYQGGGVLDDSGLQCGFNARNFVTFRMLKLVREAVIAR